MFYQKYPNKFKFSLAHCDVQLMTLAVFWPQCQCEQCYYSHEICI